MGRYDGDVYRHLYEWAMKAPRNKSEVSSWSSCDYQQLPSIKFMMSTDKISILFVKSVSYIRFKNCIAGIVSPHITISS